MFEIEIKSLLGSRERADVLRVRLEKLPGFQKIGGNKQLNHYFEGGSPEALMLAMKGKFASEKEARLKKILSHTKSLSIRSREYNGRVMLVVKATVDDTTSSNGTAREEFEEEIKMSLDALDRLLLGAGFVYQAKWSREREEYKAGDISITIDKNAGYGYLAEFEQVVSDAGEAETVKKKIRDFMRELNIEELPQDRLERMFAFYNANWKDYYGTDKTFIIP